MPASSLRWIATTAGLALAASNHATLARLTPPRGFNPCNGWQCTMETLGQATIESVADAIVANGMRDAGYVWVNLDDGFIASRDANGTLVASAPAFPSGTLGPLAVYLNASGLSLGAYTDRGTITCEGRPGSKGFEAADAATFVSWGVRWLKEDSCASSQDFLVAQADYGAMAAGLNATGVDVFFSLCGWWAGFAYFSTLSPPLANAWRIGTDVPSWERFLVNIEAAAAVPRFCGPNRGWPDVDMIGGHWSADQERAHLSVIAVIGAPLLLSWDVRDPGAATLGLAPYLNPELLAVHGDDAAPAVAARGQYYARVAGGPVTGPGSTGTPALPVDTDCDCGAPAAAWTFSPTNSSAVATAAAGTDTAVPPYGSLESVSQPGYCLGLWDSWSGACIDALGAQLVVCGDNHLGCGIDAQLWQPAAVASSADGGGSTVTLATALQWGGGTPLPGPFLSADTGVPTALYVQPRRADPQAALAQEWRANNLLLATPAAPSSSVQTVLQSARTGRCLCATAPTVANVWARWLAGGDVAVLLLNTGAAAARVTCDAGCMAALFAPSAPGAQWRARDVWARADAGTVTAAGFSSPQPLPPAGGSLLLRLSPLSSQLSRLSHGRSSTAGTASGSALSGTEGGEF